MKEIDWGNVRRKVWDPEKRWYQNLTAGLDAKTVIILFLVLFGSWSYRNDVGAYQDFYLGVKNDTCGFCELYCPLGLVASEAVVVGVDGGMPVWFNGSSFG